jgi:hypothetical protein
LSHHRFELLGYPSAGDDGQPLSAGAVAAVGEFAQRLDERVRVGEVGERERLGQDRRELGRTLTQPAYQPFPWGIVHRRA